MHENNRYIQMQRSLKHATFQHIIINVIMKYENNAETVRVNLRNTLEQSNDLHLRNIIVSVIVT